MRVHELIRELQQYPADSIVILAGDAEGNQYSPLAGVWGGVYAADTSYTGQMGLAALTAEAVARGYTADDVMTGVPAVCLVPTR